MRHSRSITFPIVVLLLAVLCPIFVVHSQTTTTVVATPSTSSPRLGETFHVTVSLSNVHNLYGLEVTLKWNPAILRAISADVRLGVETFADGVLHESSTPPAIFIAENNITQTQGEYKLSATSMAPAPAFSGSGTIVRITFEPSNLGNSALDLQSELFDYPPTDRDPRISLPIAHSTQGSSITVKTSSPTTPEPQPTDSTPPEIKVFSPVNQTYNESTVSLVFTTNKPVNWTGYSLDGKENVTVIGNVTLTEITNGLHNVTVFATDKSGNMGMSETLEFTVAVPKLESEPFPLVSVAAAVAIVPVVLACAGALFYFKKRKHKT